MIPPQHHDADRSLLRCGLCGGDVQPPAEVGAELEQLTELFGSPLQSASVLASWGLENLARLIQAKTGSCAACAVWALKFAGDQLAYREEAGKASPPPPDCHCHSCGSNMTAVLYDAGDEHTITVLDDDQDADDGRLKFCDECGQLAPRHTEELFAKLAQAAAE